LRKGSIFLLLVLASGSFRQALAGITPGDSLLPVRASGVVADVGGSPELRVAVERGASVGFAEEKAVEAELGEIELGYSTTGDHRRALNHLLKMAGAGMAGSGTIGWSRKVRYRLFDDLARVSARLRLYPLAMKCYYNASRQTTGLPPDSSFYRGEPVEESVPVCIDSIRGAFADGKEAVAYALLVAVKQPSPGKRKAFTHFSNVGHTFITLIKYNRDSSAVCRSFGFYPKKSGALDATPLHPGARSVIKDDSRHEWDELAGKFITGKQFSKIIEVLQSYDHKIYNLNHSNCTDFGLTMALVGGIRIDGTTGRWPLGRGNNPGAAGQSLLEGRVGNAGPEDAEPLFVASDHVPGRW
jgi:hypothetical protein